MKRFTLFAALLLLLAACTRHGPPVLPAPDANSSTISASAVEAVADQAVAITVRLHDADGEALARADVAVALYHSAGSLSTGQISPAASGPLVVRTDADGVASANLTAPVGQVLVSAYLGEDDEADKIGEVSVTFLAQDPGDVEPAEPSVDESTLTASADKATTGESVSLTVTLRGPNGEPLALADRSVTFSAADGRLSADGVTFSAAGETLTVVTDATGQAAAHLLGDTDGAFQATAHLGADTDAPVIGTVTVAFSSVVMDDLVVTYDGEAHSPTAVFSDTAAADRAVYSYEVGETGELLDVAPSDAGVYTVTVVAGGDFPGSATSTLTIEPRELSFAGPITFADKSYDGAGDTTVEAALDTAAIVLGDDVGLDSAMAAEFQVLDGEAWVSGGRVGAYVDGVTARVVGALELVGADADNYTFEQPIGSATISPLSLSIMLIEAQGKEYDGTTDVSVTGALNPAPVLDEDVAIAAVLASPNAGNDVSVVVTLTGADAANYTLVDPELTVDVTPRPATVTANDSDKVYGDEFTLASTAFTVSGLVGDDAIATVTLASDGTAATANVDSYTVIPSGAVGTTGTLVSNYSITYVPGGLTVQRRPLTITPSADQGKTYGDLETPLGFNQTGLVNGDTLTGAIAREPGEDVGSYAFGLGDIAVVDGNDGGNYTLVLGGNATFAITARQMAIIPTGDLSKVYGELDPDFTYTLSGDLVGDDSLTGALGRVAGENVGPYAYDLGDLSVDDGNGGDNYALSLVGDAVFVITHRTVTLGGAFTITERHYDGTTDAQVDVNGLTLVQGVEGDDVAVAPVALFDDRHVGEGKPVTLTAATSLVGADAGNYLLDMTGAPSSTGTITRAPIGFDITNKDALTYTGYPLALVVVTDPNPVPEVEPVAYTLEYRRVATPAGDELDQGVAAIRDAGLYRVTITSTDARYVGQDEIVVPVSARPVTLEAVNDGKVYGESNPSLVPEITSGSLAVGHTLTGELAYSGSDAGAYDLTLGTVKVMRAGQDVTANYALSVTGQFTIAPAPVTFDIGNAELLVDGVHLFPSDGATPIGLEVLSTPAGMTDYRLSYRRTHDASHQPIPTVRQPVPTIAAFGTYAVTIESLNPNYAGTSVRTVWVTDGVGLASPEGASEGGEAQPVEAVVNRPITITLPFLGGDGQPRPLGPVPMTFELSSTPATGLVFRYPVTGQPITSITAPAGATEVSFEVIVQTLNSAPYDVSLDVVGWSDQPENILSFAVQPQAALVVLGDAPVIGQDALSSPVTVQLQDGDGLPVPAPTDLTLALVGDGLTFVSTVTNEPIASITVPAGASSAQFRVTATQVGSFTFTVENTSGVPGVGDSDPTTVIVNPKPVVDSLDVSTMEIGETLELVVSGSAFADGAIASFNHPGLTVTSFSVDDAGQITLTVLVGIGVPAGSYDLTITNPDGGTTTVQAAITVVKPVLSANDDGPFDLVKGGNIELEVADLLANDSSTSSTVSWHFGSIVATENVSVVHNSGADTLTVTSEGEAGALTSFTYRIVDDLGTEATATVTFDVSLAPVEAIVFDDQTQFEIFKGSDYTPPTFEKIFESWPRASGGNYYEDPAGFGGAKGTWVYDEVNARVVQSVNVESHEAIVSPLSDALEYFTLEATLTSGHNDNDSIGIVIAFARVGGTNHYLVANRTHSGNAPSNGWGITYIENGQSSIVLSSDSVGGTGSGWSGSASRVKIERTGSLINAWATPWNSLNDFQGEMVIDLDANTVNGVKVTTDLSVFKGKKQYGYYTYSQQDSTFVDIEVQGGVARDLAILLTGGADSDLDGTVDTWTGSQVWRFGTGWEQVPAWTIQDELGYTREVTSVAPYPAPGGDPVGTRYEVLTDTVVLLPSND